MVNEDAIARELACFLDLVETITGGSHSGMSERTTALGPSLLGFHLALKAPSEAIKAVLR